MRMFMINPALLCNNHLIEEHHAIHDLIKAGGPYDLDRVEPQNFQQRHDELAAELTHRGFNHKTKLTPPKKTDIGLVSRHDSAQYLMDCCSHCADNIRQAMEPICTEQVKSEYDEIYFNHHRNVFLPIYESGATGVFITTHTGSIEVVSLKPDDARRLIPGKYTIKYTARRLAESLLEKTPAAKELLKAVLNDLPIPPEEDLLHMARNQQNWETPPTDLIMEQKPNAEKRKKQRAAKKAKLPEGVVPLKEICDEIGMTTAEARKILRKIKQAKYEGMWAWPADQTNGIIKALKNEA